jgi:hypothetical protein
MSSVPLHQLLYEAIWDHLGRLATRQPRSRFCRRARGRRCDTCGGRLQGLSPPAGVRGLADLPWLPRVTPSLRLGPRHRRGGAAALGREIAVTGSMNEHLSCHDGRPRIDQRRAHDRLMQRHAISHRLPLSLPSCAVTRRNAHPALGGLPPLTSEATPPPPRPPMAHEPHRAHGHCRPHHHLGCSRRAQRWKVVPVDVLPALRQAGLPVGVVGRRCRHCCRPLGHGLPTNEPPQPQWCPPPAQHVPVRRATALESYRIIASGSSRHSRTWRTCPAVCWMPMRQR